MSTIKSRRRTMLRPLALHQLWESVGADICNTFKQELTDRTEYIVNSHVDYEDVAFNIEVILKRLMQTLEASFPHVFFTIPVHITTKGVRDVVLRRESKRTNVTNVTSIKRRTRSATSHVPLNTVDAVKWKCMGYARTIKQWLHEPVTTMNAKMEELVKRLEHCSKESEEKFLVMPYTWKLFSKDGKNANHYSCIVVDLAPDRVLNRDMAVTIIDVNGHGDSELAYKNLFKEPAMGLNPFIKKVVTSLFTVAQEAMGYNTLRVSFPRFSGINVSSEAAADLVKRETKLFKDVKMKNVEFDKGVCSIATLFVIIRIACDQRKVLKEGVDVTLKRFTRNTYGGLTAYRHTLFVRAFTYSLLSFLEMDTPHYGIKGDAYIIKETSDAWSIDKLEDI